MRRKGGSSQALTAGLLLLCSFTGPEKEELADGLSVQQFQLQAPFKQKLNFHQKQTYMAIISGHWCYHWILHCKQARGSDSKFNEVLVLEHLKRKKSSIPSGQPGDSRTIISKAFFLIKGTVRFVYFFIPVNASEIPHLN